MDDRQVIEELLKCEVYWEKAKPGGIEYTAVVKGHQCKIRLNDFPESALFTLLVGQERLDLDDAPPCWHFPWQPA